MELGLLLCRNEIVPVYKKNGWEVVKSSTYFIRKSKIQKYPYTTMVLRYFDSDWPKGNIDLCGLPW